ncbi:hypothetical protein CcCBS67573_g02031 [Chytriomyces confervae]|uniref:Uncharacterized protein n=1 Tax=Chytriomyces confervae TaxID=246404 RepID=A0A507FK64_9FUNG|nr:hypothetical protein CcCBS67573_g02031 [Chytriomyces confervae]
MSTAQGTQAPEANRAFQFYWLVTALTIEISFSGLLSIGSRFLQGHFQSVYQVTTIMVVFNIASMSYCVTGLLVWSSVESNCPSFLLAANTLSHIFYTSFYCFMIAKTLVISDMDPWVAYASIAILFNRICWAAADIALSTGIWSDGGCVFVQHPVTGVAYNASDLLTDLFCTVVSIAWNWSILISDFSGMMRVIVKENS